MTNPEVAHAQAFGVELYGSLRKPHQLDVLRTITERHPAHPQRYRRPRVLLLMPRQTGKTSSVFLLACARVYLYRRWHSVYAAQQGTVSTRRFSLTDGWIDRIEDSARLSSWTTTRSQGREAIAWRRSYFMALNPRPRSARSDELDFVVMDECQEHSHERAELLEADLGPTGATRPSHQRIYAGTASAGPTWWADQVAAARAGDPAAGHLIEVGTWPADADPEDPATWWKHHPGLQHGLTTEDYLRDELASLGVDAFAREYGNRFTDTPDDAAIPLDRWDAATPDQSGERVAVAIDCTLDRSRASVVGAYDTGHLALLAQLHPRDLPDYLAGVTVPVVGLPHQRTVLRDLAERGVTTRVMQVADYRDACASFHAGLLAGRVHHDHAPELRESWTVAARGWHGDAWILSARRSGGDITAAVAAVLGHHAATRSLEPVLV